MNIFTRSQINPIIEPEGKWWKVYNPGAIADPLGNVHLFPRVMEKAEDWHSRIAHLVSKDGEHFEWMQELALERSSADELRGLEDPRVTKIGSIYHMLYAAYDGNSVQLHTAVTKDLNGKWQKQGKALTDFHFWKSGGKIFKWENGKPVEKKESKRGAHWSKSGALFGEKFDGRYKMLFGEYYIWAANSKDGVAFKADSKPFLEPRSGTNFFDNTFIEMGPPPIFTEKGWLVLYHGIDEAFRYQLGFVLADLDDPSQILYRSNEPIFGPKEDYEMGDSLIDVITGGVNAMVKLSDDELKEFYKKARNQNVMPQVTFCPGTVVRNGELWLYYGAGDTSICTAHAPIAKILELAK